MLLAAAWSSSAQHAQGQEIGTDTARLRADCLTGAWTGSVASGERSRDSKHAGTVGRRPRRGDPDLHGRAAAAPTTPARGSAFARVAAFRTGFTDGRERLPQPRRSTGRTQGRTRGLASGRRTPGSALAGPARSSGIGPPSTSPIRSQSHSGNASTPSGVDEQLDDPRPGEWAPGRRLDETLLDQPRLPAPGTQRVAPTKRSCIRPSLWYSTCSSRTTTVDLLAADEARPVGRELRRDVGDPQLVEHPHRGVVVEVVLVRDPRRTGSSRRRTPRGSPRPAARPRPPTAPAHPARRPTTGHGFDQSGLGCVMTRGSCRRRP